MTVETAFDVVYRMAQPAGAVDASTQTEPELPSADDIDRLNQPNVFGQQRSIRKQVSVDFTISSDFETIQEEEQADENEANNGAEINNSQFSSRQEVDQANQDEWRPEARCGFFYWRPDCLQVGYNWKLGLVLMCWFSFLHGMLTNGFNAVNSSSFEKKFEVSSEQIGWFTAANKFSSATTSILSSYYGDRRHKPRMLAIAGASYVVGSVLMVIPHFITEPYRNVFQDRPDICEAVKGYENFEEEEERLLEEMLEDCPKTAMSSYFYFLIVGNIVIGIGGGVVFTVGHAFIDEFSKSTSSSFNIATTFLSNAIGTAVGFAAGSVFLTIDANIDNEVQGNGVAHPAFVGAWWIGYAACSVLFVSVTLAFACFGRELPETIELRPKKLAHVQTHVSIIGINTRCSHSVAANKKFFHSFSTFVDDAVCILTNPVVNCVAIASTLQGLLTDGLQPFLVKLMGVQYGLTEMEAGIAIAVMIVVGIATGCTISGLVAHRLHMHVRSLLLLTIVVTLLGVFFGFSQMLSCSNDKVAGITVDYEKLSYFASFKNSMKVDSKCNENCRCDPHMFEPVCFKPLGIEYYSPCYAGCSDFHETNDNIFTGCTCVPEHFRLANQSTVHYGQCEQPCTAVYFLIAGLFLMLFCGFFVVVPSTDAVLRTVPFEVRSFGLAFIQAAQGLFGAIPGPLIIGTMFDQACTFRQPKPYCGGDITEHVISQNQTHFADGGETVHGACIVYDSIQVSWWLVGTLGAINFLTAICYIAAFVLYKPPSEETFSEYFASLKFWWWRKTHNSCCFSDRSREEEHRKSLPPVVTEHRLVPSSNQLANSLPHG